MKTKMLLPLLAIVFAVSGAFVTQANNLAVYKWGLHSSEGCIQGTLLDESNCGIPVTNKGRCIVDFGDETANAFNISDCDTEPLFKQN